MKNIKKYNEFLNESLRDMMVPKLKEFIEKSLYDYFEEELKSESLDFFKKMNWFKEDNLYCILDYEHHYDLIEKYFEKIIEGKDCIEKNDNELKFSYYPELEVAYHYDGTLTYSWYFDGSHIPKIINFLIKTELNELNESLRDKMKPKSHSQVLNAIKKLPDWKKYDIIIFYGKEKYFTEEELEFYKNIPHPKKVLDEGFEEKDLNKIKKAVKDDPSLLYSDNKILSPIRDGDIEFVKFLIDLGFKVNMNDLPLRLAVIDGHSKIVQLLLDNEAIPTKYIMEIALNKWDYKPDIVEMLFKYADKKEISSIDRWGNKYKGKYRPKEDYLDESLKDKMKPKSEQEIRRRLGRISNIDKLDAAIDHGIVWLVKDIIDSGLAKQSDYDRALQRASSIGNVEIVKLLLNAGANIHTEYDNALIGASKNGHIEVVKILIDAGANVDTLGGRAYMLAGSNGHKEITKLLYQAKNKKTNESLRDKMKPKSEDKILDVLMKLTPYGMLDKIITNELDDLSAFVNISQDRIELSIKELDNIFKTISDNKLNELVDKVAEWVDKNGGNSVNVTDYGLKQLSTHLMNYGFQDRHDAIVIYDDEVFKSFRILLKEFALCEVQFNNIDFEK